MQPVIRLRASVLLLTIGLHCPLLHSQKCDDLKEQPRTVFQSRQSTTGEKVDERSELESDLVKMQSLLNQMQATYGLVGNPTAPANHELQLNMDMWRILIGQMQRHVSRMEEKNSSRPESPK